MLKNGCITIDEYKATIENGEVTTVEKGSCKGTNRQLFIGDTVNYVTSLNGVTLDNWKIFYIDGDYTYLIYGDYLPNTAIEESVMSKLDTEEVYGVFPRHGREDFLNSMTTKSYWNNLLIGTINGHEVNEILSENVWAMGTPTIDLWVNSWNATYPDDILYINNDNQYGGYALGESSEDFVDCFNMSNKKGYDNTLYYPQQERKEGCYGYGIASQSSLDEYSWIDVNYAGIIGGMNCEFDGQYRDNWAIRPIIKLPSNVVNQ